jgi:ABC-type transport system involved in multi-copper enzyme maturation permease subunit
MLTIAYDTLRELGRRKFATAAVFFTLAVTILSAWGFWSLAHLHTAAGQPVSFVEIRGTTAFLVIFGAFLFSFILAFASTTLSAPILSTDVESGLLLPILARPISRVSFVLAKAVTIALAIGVYAAIVALLQLLVVRATTGYLPPDPLAAVGAVWLLSTSVLALSFALSVRLPALASSLIAVCAFGLSWMVGIIAAFGIADRNMPLIRIGVISQLLMPSDAMWRIAVFHLEPVAMLGHNGGFGPVGPFSVAAPPPVAIIWWTFAWIAVVLTFAAITFSRRDA